MVSVISITYNRANFIGETIQSVLDQTYGDFEYIIVDDGSEDDTEAIINGLKDSRIKYFKLEKTGYLSKLRNFGLKKATGKYIAFIDSDDIWEKDKLKTQVEILIKYPDLGFCFCDVLIFNNNKIIKEKIYKGHKAGTINKGNMFHDYINSKLPIYSSSTIIFRKECYDYLGELDERMRSGDHNFICRLLYSYKGCVIYSPLTKIRRHNSNHSDIVGNLPFDEYIISLERFYEQKIISKKTYIRMVSNNHYQSGILFSRSNNFSDARKKFLKSFKINPLNYKGFIRYIMYLHK
jgi:glycosyltransferase involved in cell wall biosynthesis